MDPSAAVDLLPATGSYERFFVYVAIVAITSLVALAVYIWKREERETDELKGQNREMRTELQKLRTDVAIMRYERDQALAELAAMKAAKRVAE